MLPEPEPVSPAHSVQVIEKKEKIRTEKYKKTLQAWF